MVGFEKCFDEWISQSNFHRCMLFFLEEDIVQGEGSLLFRDAKMSKGNKVVLKSPADLDSEELRRMSCRNIFYVRISP